MTPVPFDLPVRPSEASELANLVFDHAEKKPLSDEVRNRIAARAVTLRHETITPYFGSLERDPVHTSTYYLAVDGRDGVPLLLHITYSTSPSSGLFPKSILVGRMRRVNGPEIVVNYVPFGPGDYENVMKFATRLNSAFLPRPQVSRPALAVGNRHPEISLPAAFDAYRAVLKRSGLNLASTAQLSASREITISSALERRDGEDPLAPGFSRVSFPHLYHAGLWAAIRAGWRSGYSAEADHIIISGRTEDEIAQSLETARVAIREAAGFTKFTTDTSQLIQAEADPRHPQAWSDATVAEKFEALFDDEERAWIQDEFVRTMTVGDQVFEFDAAEVMRLAVKFGRSLKLNEELYEYIRETRLALKTGRTFDFEPSLDETGTLTTARELTFYMQWLKARGCPAQLVPPNLGFKKRQAYPTTIEELGRYVEGTLWHELLPRVANDFAGSPVDELLARVRDLCAVARHFQGILSVHSGSGKQAEVLEGIGKATVGKVNYKISGELELQLFDVLAEQPEGSAERALFDRMVARAEEFAANGAFGEESCLARQARQEGRGSSLGTVETGRTDGNRFLVLYLGNVVGSRDVHAPDGDRRFFKEKLDELPAAIRREARVRNTRYIDWLARNLFA